MAGRVQVAGAVGVGLLTPPPARVVGREGLAGVLRRWATPARLALAAAVVGAAVLLGVPGCGYDASWALVWGRDLLHGATLARPHALLLPTPHPLALVMGVVSWLVPGVSPRGVWVLLELGSTLALLVGCQRLAASLSPAGWWWPAWCCPVLVAGVPALAVAVSNGTVDVPFAAAAVWALHLGARRPRAALTFAVIATLARPEGIVVLLTVGLIGGQDQRQARAWQVAGLGFAGAAVWLVMGAALFGDPLAAVHVTVHNALQTHQSAGVSQLPQVLKVGAGTLPILLTVVGLAVLARPSTRQVSALRAGAALAGTSMAVIGSAALGAQIPTRYLCLELTLGVVLGVGAVAAGGRTRWPRRAAATSLLVMTGLSSTHAWHARAQVAQGERPARQGLNALTKVMTSSSTCPTLSVAPTAYLPALLLDAHQPVTVTTTPAGACRLVARSWPVALADGWGPPAAGASPEPVPAGATVLTANAQWVLYVR